MREFTRYSPSVRKYASPPRPLSAASRVPTARFCTCVVDDLLKRHESTQSMILLEAQFSGELLRIKRMDDNPLKGTPELRAEEAPTAAVDGLDDLRQVDSVALTPNKSAQSVKLQGSDQPQYTAVRKKPSDPACRTHLGRTTIVVKPFAGSFALCKGASNPS